MLQDVFIASGRGGSDFVARPQPIRAGLLHRERGGLHVGARIYPALYLRKHRSGLLGPIPSPQLLALAVNGACVGGQLATDDRLAAGAAS